MKKVLLILLLSTGCSMLFNAEKYNLKLKIMKKVYNSKKSRGFYEGSLPGMRAGGSLPKAQNGWWDKAKSWAGDKYQDFQDSTVNMSNVFGSSPEDKQRRRNFDLQVIDYVSQHPENKNYARLEEFMSQQNPGIEEQFEGPMATGQTGFDAYGNPLGNMSNPTDESFIANTPNKPIPYVKRGGILKRGGEMRTSNVLGKGGTPKARRGGSVGRNGIL